MFKATLLPAISLAIAATTLPVSSAWGQFYSVGLPPGGATGRVTDISADGRVATGFTVVGAERYAFTWTAEGGRVDIGLVPGSPEGQSPIGISGDGRTVIGSMPRTDRYNQVFRWTDQTGFQALGTLPGWPESFATDLSSDGTVIVGTLQQDFFYQPFRWTQAGGFEMLRTSSGGLINADIEAVNADGSVIVGTDILGGRGFTWTEESGYRYLPSIPGTNTPTTSAIGISRDGRFIVGFAGQEAVGAMWTPTDTINLGKFAGFRSFIASEVTDDGTLVAGTSDGIASRDLATVWTQAGGLQSLADYLAEQGVIIPMNVRLETCVGISADGQTFSGSATIDGNPRSTFGYIVTIPAPASACMLLGVLVCFRRKRD